MSNGNGNILLKYWPVITAVVMLAFSAGVSHVTLYAHGEELKDISESVDENEDDIQEIKRILIRRQGEVENRTQRIEIEQQQQGRELEEVGQKQDQILELLRGIAE